MEVSNSPGDLCFLKHSWDRWQVKVGDDGVDAEGYVKLDQVSPPWTTRKQFELVCDGGFVHATCQNSSERTVEFNMTLPPHDPTLNCDLTVTGKVGVPFANRQFCTYGGHPLPTPAIDGTLWKVDDVDRCYDAGDKCFPAGVQWSSKEEHLLVANGTPSAAGQYGVWIVLKDQPHAKDKFVTFDISP
jgi:hypothetical protein